MANQSARGKIVFLLSLIVMIFTVLSYISITRLMRSNESRITDEIVESIHNALLSLSVSDGSFFGEELNSLEFYKTHQSPYLTVHDTILSNIHRQLQKATDVENMEIDPALKNISNSFLSYDSTFKLIVNKIIQRGYEQYGLVGEMQKTVDELERGKFISECELTSLKLQQRDYLLTAEHKYAERFDSIVNVLAARYALKKQALQLIQDNSTSMHKLVTITDEIGLETQKGLKRELNNRTGELLSTLGEVERKGDSEIGSAYQNGITLFLIGVIGSTLICIVLVVQVARKV